MKPQSRTRWYSRERDLRPPEPEETPLSPLEVRQGVREGSIPEGPVARHIAFRQADVLVRQRVLVADL